MSQHFGEAPFFALVAARRSDGAFEEQRIVSNPHSKVEMAKGIRVAEWLVAQKIDVVLSREAYREKDPPMCYVKRGSNCTQQTVERSVKLSFRRYDFH